MKSFVEWIGEQTVERKIAVLEHLQRCRRLGELNRSAPSSEEAIALRDEIAAYYRQYPE